MKKTPIVFLLLLALWMSGCGQAQQNKYESFAEELSSRESLSFTAELTAVYPTRSAEFSLRYNLDGEEQRITVLSPGRISGIQASVERGKTQLAYDGLILDTGDLNDFGLSPMSALPVLIDTMCNGHVDAVWEEDELSVVKLLYDDHTTAQVWFTEEMIPVRAELFSDGVLKIQCEIDNWS